MVNFLERVISVLPEAQKIAIKSLVSSRAKSGELRSIREIQDNASLLYNQIKAKLGSVILSPVYANPDDKISSEDYNSVMQEIYLDLTALYANIDQISKLTKQYNVSLESDYLKSRSAIEKLINDVKVFVLRKQHPEFNEIKLVDFNSSTNYSKKGPIASVDTNIRVLELKPAYNSRVHLTNRSNRTTKIYTKTISHGLKADLSSMFPIENIVDQKPETFWASLVLADSTLSQIYEKASTDGTAYSVVVEGPVVEIYFKFSHAEKINTIKVAPFSEYPIRIIDIAYKEIDTDTVYTPLKNFEPITTLDWEEFNFSPVFANELRITIAQENYNRLTYAVPKSLLANTDLFQKILNKRASKISSNNISDSDFSKNVIGGLGSYEEAISALATLYASMNIDATVQPNIDYISSVENAFKTIYNLIDPEYVAFLTSEEVLQQPNPLVNINKYEYLLGLREVEVGYQLYYPVCNYESEKFNVQATASEIQLEVDERHTNFNTQWESNYHKTSTAWEIDIGAGRRIPIHPKNIKEDDVPSVKDERIEFSILNNKAYTRLGGYYSVPYRVKKDGALIPPNEYTVTRVTGSVPKLELYLTGTYFDTSSIYTIDYAVDPSSYSIDVLSNFNSEAIPVPEVFTSTNTNNEIELSKFPFVNYEIVNSTGVFHKYSSESTWTFTPPQPNYSSGQLFIYPTIVNNVGTIIQSGHITGNLVTGMWGTQSGRNPIDLTTLSNNYFGTINGIDYGYFVKPMDSIIFAEVDTFSNSTELLFKQPPVVTVEQCQRWDAYSTGVVFSGQLTGTISGHLTIDYSLGVGVNSDGQIYTLSDLSYTPMTVSVGSVVAKNITNYETLVHPAFSIANNRDNNYQYIQAGKTIYFNQNIADKEIRVDYRWITEYVKVIGTLYCNTAINPDLTPKVNEIRVFINNLVI